MEELPGAARKYRRAGNAGGGGDGAISRPEQKRWLATELEEWVFSAEYADRILREHFQLQSLDGFGLAANRAQ